MRETGSGREYSTGNRTSDGLYNDLNGETDEVNQCQEDDNYDQDPDAPNSVPCKKAVVEYWMKTVLVN